MKHLLGIADLSAEEIWTILDTAEEMHDIQSRPIKKLPALRGRWDVDEAPGGRQAWFTWLALCPDAQSPAGPPEERVDGRWRWLLPQLAADSPLSSPLPGLPGDPSSRAVRDFLLARQGNACACVRSNDMTGRRFAESRCRPSC